MSATLTLPHAHKRPIESRPTPTSPRERWVLIAAIIAVPAVLLGATAVARWLNGFAKADLAHFDQAIWLASRGREPMSTFFGETLLEDHFGPGMLVFAPLYRIVATPVWLILGQVVAAWWAVWLIVRRLGPAVDGGCAGINRHGGGDERALHRRSSDPRWPRAVRRRP